jgi:hypothetical protein
MKPRKPQGLFNFWPQTLLNISQVTSVFLRPIYKNPLFVRLTSTSILNYELFRIYFYIWYNSMQN